MNAKTLKAKDIKEYSDKNMKLNMKKACEHGLDPSVLIITINCIIVSILYMCHPEEAYCADVRI